MPPLEPPTAVTAWDLRGCERNRERRHQLVHGEQMALVIGTQLPTPPSLFAIDRFDTPRGAGGGDAASLLHSLHVM